jgi:assimilatory nitrate reductase catalytic subunit
MNPQDMKRLGIAEADVVHIISKRGSVMVRAQASEALQPMQCFMAMHWGSAVLSGRDHQGQALTGVNALTISDYCATSKQPELKHAAVRILKAELPWRLIGMALLPEQAMAESRQRLQDLMPSFSFASCTPFANDPLDAGSTPSTGLLFRAADHAVPADAVLERIEALLQLTGPAVVRYADKKRGQRRAALLLRDGVTGNARLQAFLLSGDTSAQEWVTTLLKDGLPAQNYSRAVLGASAQPPVPVASRGKVVCTCFDVTDVQIDQQLSVCGGDTAARLAAVQSALQCGTNCGSCLPELRRKAQASAAA